MRTKKGSNTFNSRLAAYSATAGAVLLTAPASRADTIVNITDTGSFTFGYTASAHFSKLSFNAGVAHSLYFWGRQSFKTTSFLTTTSYFNQIGIGAVGGGADFVRATHAEPFAFPGLVNLAKSAQIAAGIFVQGGGGGVHTNAPIAFSAFATGAHPFKYGSFIPAGPGTPAAGYLGFKHMVGVNDYYGWLRISVSEDAQGRPSVISLVADSNGIVGAYDATPNGTAILAGEFSPVPEPSVGALGGLGLLALGAAGVRELRRRKNSAAA